MIMSRQTDISQQRSYIKQILIVSQIIIFRQECAF